MSDNFNLSKFYIMNNLTFLKILEEIFLFYLEVQ